MKPFTITAITLAMILLGVYTVNSIDEKKDKSMTEMPENTMTAVFAGGRIRSTESHI